MKRTYFIYNTVEFVLHKSNFKQSLQTGKEETI